MCKRNIHKQSYKFIKLYFRKVEKMYVIIIMIEIGSFALRLHVKLDKWISAGAEILPFINHYRHTQVKCLTRRDNFK